MNTSFFRPLRAAAGQTKSIGRGVSVFWLLLAALTALVLHTAATAAPQESARDGTLIAYDDATVLDSQTGLMWTRADNGTPIDWYGATRYCAQLRHAGHGDWRLPSAQELAMLLAPNKSKSAPSVALSTLLTVTGPNLWSSKSLYEPGHGTEPVAYYMNTAKNGKLEIAPKLRADLNAADPKLGRSLRVLAVRDARLPTGTLITEPFGKRVDRFRSRAGALTNAKNLPAPLQLALANGLLADDTRAAMRATTDNQLRSTAIAGLQLLIYPEWLPPDINALQIKSDTTSNRDTAPNWTAQWQQSGRWFQVAARGQKIHVFAELRERTQVVTPSEKVLSAWSTAREVVQFSENARLGQYEATRGYALVGLAPRPNEEGVVLLTDGEIVAASYSARSNN